MIKNTFFVGILLLSGCVSREQVSNIDNVNYFASGKDVDAVLTDGLSVANRYLSLADSTASRQDGLAVFNIALAAGTALAVIGDASANTISRAGVVGLATNQTSRYFDPVTARDSLTRAAKRMLCIVSAGRAYADPLDTGVHKKIVVDAFLSVKFFLRDDLNRQPNDYSGLFADYKAVLEGQASELKAAEQRAGDTQQLLENVKECIPAV